jgi:hypothetical protein
MVVDLPGVAAGCGGPGDHCAAELGNLAGVIAVVGDHLPKNGLYGVGLLLVCCVNGFDLAIKLFG